MRFLLNKLSFLLTVVFTITAPIASNAIRCEDIFRTHNDGSTVRYHLTHAGIDLTRVNPGEQYNPLARRFSYDTLVEFNREIVALRPDLSALQNDAGILLRMVDFKKFYLKNKTHLKNKSALEVRAAFSQFLGKSIWYRGMVLLPSQAKNILINGIAPRRLQDFFHDSLDIKNAIQLGEYGSADLVNKKNQSESLVNDFPLTQIIADRIEDNYIDSLIPISKRKIVAEGVAAWVRNSFLRRGAPSELAVYLFELELPNLDVFSGVEVRSISQSNINFERSYQRNGHVDFQIKDKNGIGKEKKSYRLHDPATESEVFYYIAPHEIKSWERIDSPRALYLGNL